MEVLVEMLNRISTKLHSNNKYTRILGKLEQKCGYNKFFIVSFLMIIIAVYTAVGYGNEFVCTFTSIVYPIYASMNEMQRGTPRDTEIILIYWVIFALIYLFENLFDSVMTWIPYYWLMKMLFLIFCFAPVSNNLSLFLYRNVLSGLMTSILVEKREGSDLDNERSTKSCEMETDSCRQEDCGVENSDQEEDF
ncbi:receptor expression-enhancing protein 5-like [Centruroides vittatus]|uniref:receptor expression-enhancing protein 5-like n=1 Tax=Centruroides vittatus TaxID=120091 RepID=UPI00350EA9A6